MGLYIILLNQHGNEGDVDTSARDAECVELQEHKHWEYDLKQEIWQYIYWLIMHVNADILLALS